MKWRNAQARGLLLLVVAWGCGDSITGPGPDGYTEAELEYFAEIAFGAEFGGSAQALLRRWPASPLLRIHGTPTAADEATLAQVIAEIEAITQGVRPEITDGPGDIDVYFVPVADFPLYEPNHVPGNTGFVWVWWDQPQHIVRARIMVASDITQEGRSHVIREELTQSLGLLGDSQRYPESIFYAPPLLIDSYAAIDRAVIEMLYRPELRPGMTLERAQRVLRGLRRRDPPVTAANGQPPPPTLSPGLLDPGASVRAEGSAGAGSPAAALPE